MKITKSFHICVLLLLAINSQTLFGQGNFIPGYVITNENDTIVGFIDHQLYKDQSAKCLFKTRHDSPPIEYEPSDIEAYRLTENDRYYITKSLPIGENELNLFVQYILNCKYDLFYLRKDGKDYYFIEGDSKLYELKNEKRIYMHEGTEYERYSNEYIGILMALFKDDPQSQSKIKQTDLNHKSLIKLVTTYHDNTAENEACVVYEKAPPGISFALAPVLTYNFTQPQLQVSDYETNVTFEDASYLSGGMQIEIGIPRFGDNLNVKSISEISYTSFTGEGIRQLFQNIYITDMEVKSFNFSQIIGFQYSLKTGKFSPHLFAGYGLRLPFDAGSTITYSHGYHTEEFSTDNFMHVSSIAMASLGMQYDFEGWKAFVNLNYRYDFDTYYRLDYKLSIFSVSVGAYL